MLTEKQKKMVEDNMGLAIHVCKKHFHRGEPEEIRSFAMEGLVKAVKGYNENSETSFSTYAGVWIEGEINRRIRDGAFKSIRLPRSANDAIGKILYAFRKTCTDRDIYNPEEISKITGLKEEEIEKVLVGTTPMLSIDTTYAKKDGDSECSFGDTIPSKKLLDTTNFDFEMLDLLEKTLTKKELEVIRLKFEQDLPQREIGKIVGEKQVQVSRILKRAIEKLQETVMI